MRTCNCPNCNAALSFSDDREFGFCEYCGSKISFDDFRSTQRIVDEAKIKQAEAEKTIRLKELELEKAKFEEELREKKAQETFKKRFRTIWAIFMLAVSVFFIIQLLIGTDDSFVIAAATFMFVALPVGIAGGIIAFKVIPNKEMEKAIRKQGGICFPRGIEPFDERKVDEVKKALKDAGFLNVKCISLHDLTLGLLETPDRVEEIIVNGQEITEGGSYYLPDAQITVTYHDFK